MSNTFKEKTVRIYDTEPLTTDFTAKVVSCLPTEDGKNKIILDKTAFFPEGGGQPADSGCIDGTPILGLSEEGGNIIHVTESRYPQGQRLLCSVNRGERLRHMASHTAEHIISSLITKHFGCHNVGFHIGHGEVTADFDGELTHEQVIFIEREANRAIRENMPITVSYPSRDELASLEYRSKLELTENVRIVTIGDLDKCACCAPHMPFTGNVGSVVISDCKRYKGGVRMTLAAGEDASALVRRDIDSIREIAVSLSTKPESVLSAYGALLETSREQRQANDALSGRINQLILESINDCGAPIFLADPRNDKISLRRLAVDITEKTGMPALVLGCDNKFTVSAKSGVKEKFSRLKAALGCLGGGSDTVSDGLLPENIGVSALKEMFLEIF